MAETAWSVDRLPAVAARTDAPRHTALVRVTHWLTTACFLALLISGAERSCNSPSSLFHQASQPVETDRRTEQRREIKAIHSHILQ
jgi:cytochrome b561